MIRRKVIIEFLGYQNLARSLSFHQKGELIKARQQFELAATRIEGNEVFLACYEANLLISEANLPGAEARLLDVADKTAQRESENDAYLFFYSQFFLALGEEDWIRAKEMKIKSEATEPNSILPRFLPIWDEELLDRVAREIGSSAD